MTKIMFTTRISRSPILMVLLLMMILAIACSGEQGPTGLAAQVSQQGSNPPVQKGLRDLPARPGLRERRDPAEPPDQPGQPPTGRPGKTGRPRREPPLTL